MATLHFHYGVMGASKTAILLINAHNFQKNDTNVEIIKPQYDTRFDVKSVKSRIGLEAPAIPLKNLDGYMPSKGTGVVLVDEVQFFSPSDIDKLVYIADNINVKVKGKLENTIVMCYGLMVDSNEQLFPASKRLIEVGAKLHRMESNCQMPGCMHLATHHLRFDASGKVIRAGDQFALGDSNYKSVCRQHYNEIYHGLGHDGKGSR